MPKSKRSKANATKAARARAGKAEKHRIEVESDPEEGSQEDIEAQEPIPVEDFVEDEFSCGNWDGTVAYHMESDSEDEDWWESGSEFTDDSDLEEAWNELEEVPGEIAEDLDACEILQNLREQCSLHELEKEVDELLKPTPYEEITEKKTKQQWGSAETNRGLGYNGQSDRTVRHHEQMAREKEERDSVSRNSNQAAAFRSFFALRRGASSSAPEVVLDDAPSPGVTWEQATVPTNELQLPKDVSDHVCTGYLSDESVLSDSDWEDEENLLAEFTEHLSEGEGIPTMQEPPQVDESERSAFQTRRRAPSASFGIRPVPAPKRRRLEVPAREAKRLKREKRQRELAKAHIEIGKLLVSKKEHFDAGRNGLQARRARAIQTCLKLMVKNHRRLMDASERASEAMGFSTEWGSRQVREWVNVWVEKRELPKSSRGCHAKVYSLLDDPEVCTELCSFLRSNKWSMDPAKLSEFTKQKLLPDEAKKYLHQVVSVEMPRGLKKYLEVELFPRVQMKVARGISLRTAQRWLRKEGFRYTHYKKALYYDGHEREDVVDDRQDRYLPAMEELKPRLVGYNPQDIVKELPLNLAPGERKIVVVAHDEMTAQAHDGKRMSWVWKGEQPLRKKGVGRGIHQSDVICSTVGWMKEASVTLEYGKNHEGFWNGEMFVEQVETKIIPVFEKLHGPEFQAAFLIDNSQGHSAYAKDALIACRMNLNPGGKQPHMCDGWFMKDGVCVSQPMSFPPDHPSHAGLPKGMKQVLLERDLWRSSLIMQCSNSKNADGSSKKCESGVTDCCARRILENQADFKAQKPLVQEVIEKAGHICIFLPKFHCELNFIEYFWGSVKRYLREHCDYTFEGLKKNMEVALASVPVTLIRKWENRTKRWMEAYRKGLGAHEAQMEVKHFSSVQYSSHRRAPAIRLDA